MPSTLPELVTEAFAYFRSFPPTAAAAMSLEAHPQGRVRMATLLSEAGAFAGHYATEIPDVAQEADKLYMVWNAYYEDRLHPLWSTSEDRGSDQRYENVIYPLYLILSETVELAVANLPEPVRVALRRLPGALRDEVATLAFERIRTTWIPHMNQWLSRHAGGMEAGEEMPLLPEPRSSSLDVLFGGQGGLFGSPVVRPLGARVVDTVARDIASGQIEDYTRELDENDLSSLLDSLRMHVPAHPGAKPSQHPRALWELSDVIPVQLSEGAVASYYGDRPVGDYEDHEATRYESIVLLTNLKTLPDLLVNFYVDFRSSRDEPHYFTFALVLGGVLKTSHGRTTIVPRTMHPSEPIEEGDGLRNVLFDYVTSLLDQQISTGYLRYMNLPQIAWDEATQAADGVEPVLESVHSQYASHEYARRELATVLEGSSNKHYFGDAAAKILRHLSVEPATAPLGGPGEGWVVTGNVLGKQKMTLTTSRAKDTKSIVLAVVTYTITRTDLPFGGQFEQWVIRSASIPGGPKYATTFRWYSALNEPVSRVRLAQLLRDAIETSCAATGIYPEGTFPGSLLNVRPGISV